MVVVTGSNSEFMTLSAAESSLGPRKDLTEVHLQHRLADCPRGWILPRAQAVLLNPKGRPGAGVAVAMGGHEAWA